MAAAALLLAPAILAGSDPDREGWFIDVDFALATPGNTNTPLLASAPADEALCCAGSTSFTNDIEWMEWDDDAAYTLGFGYSWGEKGTLRVSYWTYEDTADSSGFAPSYYYAGGYNFNWFTVGPTNSWGYTFYYDMGWEFDQEIEATTIDIEYTRTKASSNPLALTYGVGVRYASFEEELEGRYTADPLGAASGPWLFPAQRSTEGDGVGFTASVGALYDFTDYIGISTGIRVGFLTAEVESEHQIIDQDGYYNLTGTVWSEESETEDEVANTLDFTVDVNFSAGAYLDIGVGYFYSTWSDLGQFQLGRSINGTDDQAGLRINGENRDRVSWSGPRVSLKWKF